MIGAAAVCDGLGALTCIAAAVFGSGQPPADLHFSLSGGPTNVHIFHPVTLTYRVTNGGPSTATDVGLKVPLGELWRLRSMTTTRGTCGGARTYFCPLGDIPAGQGATVTVVASPQSKGRIHPRGGLTSTSPDPNPNDNYGSIEVVSVDPFTGLVPRNRSAKVKDDALQLRFACGPAVPKFCRGSVAIARPRKGKKGKPPPPPEILGANNLSLPAGTHGKLRIRLNDPGIKLVNKKGKIRVLVLSTMRDGARTNVARSAPLVLIGPPKPKPKK